MIQRMAVKSVEKSLAHNPLLLSNTVSWTNVLWDILWSNRRMVLLMWSEVSFTAAHLHWQRCLLVTAVAYILLRRGGLYMLLLAHVNYDFIRHEYIQVYATSLNNSNKHKRNAVVAVIWVLVFSLGPWGIVGGRPKELRFLPALWFL